MKLETLLIHGGLEAGTHGESTVPLSQSSGFAHRTAEEMADVFRGKRPGFLYTRIQNPTSEAFEKRLALLEGGIGAIATASGMAAISTAVLTIAGAGDEILASSSLFGGTYSLFKETLPNFGIAVRFFDPADLSSLEAGINDKTRLVFIETIGNPKMDVPDIAAVGGKAGAVFTFGLGSRERAFSFINRLILAKNVPNLGDAKTLAIHPASTIYCDFSPEERQLLGVTDDMVRLSAGIEAIEDLYQDFGQALRRTGGEK